MHDEAAHTSVPFVTPMKTVSQLGEFFRHSVRDWVKSIGNKGFISMQVTSISLLSAMLSCTQSLLVHTARWS